MKTLMRTKDDARFQGNSIKIETHLSFDGNGCYDLYIDIEREIDEDGRIARESKVEYMIASTKREAQKEVTRIARKIIKDQE